MKGSIIENGWPEHKPKLLASLIPAEESKDMERERGALADLQAKQTWVVAGAPWPRLISLGFIEIIK
jgi:hypothetical protein